MGIKKSSFKDLRRTGFSTSIALKTIASAIDNPYKWTEVWDHAEPRFKDAVRHTASIITEITEKLDLKFEFKKSNTLNKIFIRSLHLGTVVEDHDSREATLEDRGIDASKLDDVI